MKILAMAAALACFAPAGELTDVEREAFLSKAQVKSMKQLSQGITGSLRAVLVEGAMIHEAHIQTIDESKTRFEGTRGTEMNFRDSYKFNVAAYELAKMLDLNMVPPSVERRVGGKSAAVTWWVDDVLMTEGDRRKKNLSAPDMEFWNRQAHTVRLFDQLIFNTDRNLGNLVISKDWRVWMIDHTRAFRRMTKCPELQGVKMVDRNLLDSLRKLNREDMRQRLGRWLLNAEVDGVLARRDELVKHIDGLIQQKGEGAVLFDRARP
jgi:hypothetical protein